MSSQPVKGLDATLAVLSAFPANLQRNAISRGMRAAGNVVRDEARLRAPKETGKMAKAIKTGSPRKLENGVHSIRVRLDGEHSFLGIFNEYGVRPHLISAGDADVGTRSLNRRARSSGVLTRLDNGLVRIGGYEYMPGPRGKGEREALKIRDAFVSGAVLHPGVPARPFMRPALDSKGGEAVQALAEVVRDFVEIKTGFRA